jgi:hypothetical protein
VIIPSNRLLAQTQTQIAITRQTVNEVLPVLQIWDLIRSEFLSGSQLFCETLLVVNIDRDFRNMHPLHSVSVALHSIWIPLPFRFMIWPNHSRSFSAWATETSKSWHRVDWRFLPLIIVLISI